MRKRPHVNTYNAQKLYKELKNMSQEQRDSRYWWTNLSSAWDQWSLDQLKRLLELMPTQELMKLSSRTND